ncbi:XRE family transcriptional regulator [Methylobacterium sp. UNC378MF]|uniref:LexA family transcriptional regulator n=1 Tax=Methylobacterium sp. UNC378MF TaxID=1502748 RepID=UPI00244EAD5F|nr:XRE family transcriptional regulator [Methylobacterium sp. UNC378MF]
MGKTVRPRNNLKRLREASGMTQEQAAAAFGMSKGGYIKIEDGDRGLKAERIAKAAEIFKVQPSEISDVLADITSTATPKFEDVLLERARAATAERDEDLLSVVGEVAAGRWIEIDDFVDEPAFDPVPVRSDPRWPSEHQYGLVVRGESINRFAADGDVLVCISAIPTRYRPKDGDLVIVELRRNAGLLRQRTAKRFLRTDTHVELWPDSDHERWQKPIIIPKGLTPLEFFLEEEGGGIEAEIVAFVASAVRQVQRWRRP